jgi:hypothetical protein
MLLYIGRGHVETKLILGTSRLLYILCSTL